MAGVRSGSKGRSGQTSTEYFVLISVVVIGIVGASFAFVPSFRNGVGQLAYEVSTILDTHQIGGIGSSSATSGTSTGTTGTGTTGVPNATTNGSTTTAAANDPALGNAGTYSTVPGTNSSAADTGNSVSNSTLNSSPGSPTSGSSNTGTYQTTTESTHVTHPGGGYGRYGRFDYGGYGDFIPPTVTTVTTTVTGDNPGGGGNKGNQVYDPAGTVKADVQGNIASNYASAVQANPSLAGQPVCGPALVASLTGQQLTPAFVTQLGKGGFLQQVTIQTSITHDNGDTTTGSTSTTTATPGVMTSNQVSAYLNSVGWHTNVTHNNDMNSLFTALSSGEHVIVRYDSCGSGGNCGHFAQVLAIHSGYVLLDSSSGTVWMPIDGFRQRWQADGREMVTGNPPGTSTTVAWNGGH